VLNTAMGFYEAAARATTAQVLARTVLAAVLCLPLAYGIFSLMPEGLGSSEVMSFSVTLGHAGINLRRLFATHKAERARVRQRVLILGTGDAARVVRETLGEADPHTQVIGFVAGPNEQGAAVPAAQVLPQRGSLADTALKANVSEIVVALSERRNGSMPLRELLECRIHGVQVSDINTHFEKTLGQVLVSYVKADWLIFGNGFNHGTLRRAVKRVFDLALASLLLIACAPLLLLTMLMIRLESPGPVLFRQERVGRDGQPFRVLKLRSMRLDAERDGPRWASAADPRVTRVGQVIRLLRIDELPQLLNVLAGDMSMVGPRPERPFFVEQLTRDIPYYAVRHSVKPGLTGWAQVRYQYGSTVEDARSKLQYDLYYVKNHGVMLDLLILLETVVVVATGRGAR
jgi:sugar transferase (PEP-CTERM system associated)